MGKKIKPNLKNERNLQEKKNLKNRSQYHVTFQSYYNFLLIPPSKHSFSQPCDGTDSDFSQAGKVHCTNVSFNTQEWISCPPQTLFLVADQRLQSDGSLHLDRHLFVIYQILFDQLHSIPQHQLVMETQRTEGVQHPAGLTKESIPSLYSIHTISTLVKFVKAVQH